MYPAPSRSVTVLLTVVLGSFAQLAVAFGVDRVEPPSWWIGMQEPTVQLMVYGDDIARARVTTDHPGVTVRATHRTGSEQHLFVDLHIDPEARSGQVGLVFTGPADAAVTHAFPLNTRAPGSADRRGFDPSDVIYLLMPDRFANGDRSNDIVAELDDGLDRENPYGRHGGDLQGIIDRLDYIAGMGFTQLWLNPVLENDLPESSYHGYAATDFYRVDARLGSNGLYRELAEAAAERGIGIIQDIVLNHAGSGHRWVAAPPADDWLNRQGLPLAFTNHMRESLLDPHAAPSDVRLFQEGWFVETMPDLNQRNPFLATYLIQNTIWWIEYAGLSGLRVDTWSYPDKAYLAEWTRRVLAEYPGLNIVGEEWSVDPAIVGYWQAGSKRHDDYDSYVPSMMDFPLQQALVDALTQPESWGTGVVSLYRVLAADYHYGDPHKLVIFADNHDMSRIFTQLDADPARFRMAMTILLTMRGIPQIFYGTEILMGNPGTESHGVIRTDFPGGWGEEAPNAFTGEGLSADAREAQDFLRSLLNWRQTASAVHAGRLTHYAREDGIYVYFRHDARQTLMVAVNRNDEEQQLETARFAETVGAARRARNVLTGATTRLADGLALPPMSATIFELE